jgi:hypothetical protein
LAQIPVITGSTCERRKSELASDVHRQEEMMRAVEQGREPKFQIETPSRIIDRIDFDGPDADLSREVNRPSQCIDYFRVG